MSEPGQIVQPGRAAVVMQSIEADYAEPIVGPFLPTKTGGIIPVYGGLTKRQLIAATILGRLPFSAAVHDPVILVSMALDVADELLAQTAPKPTEEPAKTG